MVITRGEEKRREYRCKLVDRFKKWASDGEWNKEGFSQVAPSDHAIYVIGSKKKWHSAGKTILVAQSATGKNIDIGIPNQQRMNELKHLANEDSTEGLVREIDEIHWAFYFSKFLIMRFCYRTGQPLNLEGYVSVRRG